MSGKTIDDLAFEPERVICEKCGGIVKYTGSGCYVCEDCGHEVMDDFGKVKAFLEKRGPSNIMEIAYGTGLEHSVVSKLLKDGRIQVYQNSAEGLICASCGAPIQRGKYCVNCSGRMADKRKDRVHIPEGDEGKMRFMSTEEKTKKGKKGK